MNKQINNLLDAIESRHPRYFVIDREYRKVVAQAEHMGYVETIELGGGEQAAVLTDRGRGLMLFNRSQEA